MKQTCVRQLRRELTEDLGDKVVRPPDEPLMELLERLNTLFDEQQAYYAAVDKLPYPLYVEWLKGQCAGSHGKA